MNVHTDLRLSCFAVALTLVASLDARAVTISDQMLITSGSTVVFNQQIVEPTSPALLETPLVYGHPFLVSSLTNLLAVKVVALTEPPNSVLDGTEIPVTLPSGSKVMLSDVVISVPGTLTGLNMTGSVILVSDGDPNLSRIAGMMPGAWSNVTVMPETGSLQDVTSALAITDVDVQVLSDVEVVPEPGTVALLGGGLLGGYLLRRRTAGSDRSSEPDPE